MCQLEGLLEVPAEADGYPDLTHLCASWALASVSVIRLVTLGVTPVSQAGSEISRTLTGADVTPVYLV